MTDPDVPMPRRPSDPGRLELRGEIRAMVARRLSLAAVGLVVLILLAAMTYTVLTIRYTQEVGAQRGRDIVASTRQIERLATAIESCTSPDGECYQRSQAQTGSAVASINEITIYAAACAKQPAVDTARQIRLCVERSLRIAEQRG